MKKKFLIINLIILLFLNFPIIAEDSPDNVIGIISGIKGSFIHKYNNKEIALTKTTRLYMDSVIILNSEGNGWIEVLTESGPVKYSRFPLSGFSGISSISKAAQDKFITAIGGMVLGTRDSGFGDIKEKGYAPEWSMDDSLESKDVFERYLPIDMFDENNVEQGMSLVLSANEIPEDFNKEFYFKLKEYIEPVSIKYIVYDFASNNIIAMGSYMNSENSWIFTLNSFDYTPGKKYRVENYLLLKDDSQIEWDFSYGIYSKDRISEIDAEVTGVTGYESEYDWSMIYAAHYQTFGLTFKILEMLRNAGLDLSGVY